MRYCKRCVQPDTRPGVYFDKNGVCGACLWEEEKKSIDWDAREAELYRIADWAKREARKRGTHDCVCGVSGGKDSHYVSLYARDRLGLNCLLVNSAPDQLTELGQQNLDNLYNLGFDMIIGRVNRIVLKKLVRKDFYENGNLEKPTEYPLNAIPLQIAFGYRIPLIINGENSALTLGVRKNRNLDGDATQAFSKPTIKGGNAFTEYGGYEGITEKDLLLYQYPDHSLFEKLNTKAIWLQWYDKNWSQIANAEVAIRHGMKVREGDLHELGRFYRFFCIDTDFHIVNQLLKYVKFGFGFATDEACYAIRDGRMTREEGFRLVREYDGLCGEKYIKMVCDYMEISVDEFWQVVENFRNRNLFEEKNGKWVLESDYK